MKPEADFLRTFLACLCAALVSLPLAARAVEDSGVTLRLTKTDCFPGDVVELQARMTRSDLAEFKLKLPKQEGLHLLAHQEGPVRYDEGNYTQQATWVLQPTRSGKIELTGLIAVVKRNGAVTESDLPVQTLHVRSYPVTEDAFTPEALPLEEPAAPAVRSRGMLALSVGAAVLLILIFALRRQPRPAAPRASPDPSLDDVCTSLEAGETPAASIQRLLAHDESLSPEVRVVLERAIYDGRIERKVLLAQLREATR